MIFSKKRKEKRSSNNNSSEANQNSSCLALALCDHQERESRANKPGSAHTTISSQATWVEIGVSECVRRTYIHTYDCECMRTTLIVRSLCVLSLILLMAAAGWLLSDSYTRAQTHTHTHKEQIWAPGAGRRRTFNSTRSKRYNSHSLTCTNM